MNAYQPVESLRQDLAEKGVKYAMASYVDIHGAIKGKFVPLNHLDRMMKVNPRHNRRKKTPPR